MTLTTTDLSEIRAIVREEVGSQVAPLAGRIEALENDVKEIYAMLSRMEKLLMPDKEFQKLSVERKLLKLNRDLQAMAREAGVSLPR